MYLVVSFVLASNVTGVKTSQMTRSPRTIHVREPVGRAKLESTAFSQEEGEEKREAVQNESSVYTRKKSTCCKVSNTELCFWTAFCCLPSYKQCCHCLESCCSCCCQVVDEITADEEL